MNANFVTYIIFIFLTFSLSAKEKDLPQLLQDQFDVLAVASKPVSFEACPALELGVCQSNEFNRQKSALACFGRKDFINCPVLSHWLKRK